MINKLEGKFPTDILIESELGCGDWITDDYSDDTDYINVKIKNSLVFTKQWVGRIKEQQKYNEYLLIPIPKRIIVLDTPFCSYNNCKLVNEVLIEFIDKYNRFGFMTTPILIFIRFCLKLKEKYYNFKCKIKDIINPMDLGGKEYDRRYM